MIVLIILELLISYQVFSMSLMEREYRVVKFLQRRLLLVTLLMPSIFMNLKRHWIMLRSIHNLSKHIWRTSALVVDLVLGDKRELLTYVVKIYQLYSSIKKLQHQLRTNSLIHLYSTFVV